jgi:hypothetical protein
VVYSTRWNTSIILSPGSTHLADIVARRKWRHVWADGPGEDIEAPYYPLLELGWVLQERLLSARVVHFTTNELMWECREAITCECSGQIPEEISGGITAVDNPGSIGRRNTLFATGRHDFRQAKSKELSLVARKTILETNSSNYAEPTASCS